MTESFEAAFAIDFIRSQWLSQLAISLPRLANLQSQHLKVSLQDSRLYTWTFSHHP